MSLVERTGTIKLNRPGSSPRISIKLEYDRLTPKSCNGHPDDTLTPFISFQDYENSVFFLNYTFFYLIRSAAYKPSFFYVSTDLVPSGFRRNFWFSICINLATKIYWLESVSLYNLCCRIIFGIQLKINYVE